MATTSADICAAADALRGFVGFNQRSGRYIVRFSEDSFGLDVADDQIIPTSEFVWRASADRQGCMSLSREALQLLREQNVNDRLNLDDTLLLYLRRDDLPEIVAERIPRA